MGIWDRRCYIEQEVQKQGHGFVNDGPYPMRGHPWWTAYYLFPENSMYMTRYNKHWGKQGLLDIETFMHTPEAGRQVKEVSIIIFHDPLGSGSARNESYNLWYPKKEPAIHDDFCSTAQPSGIRHPESRPLTRGEIQEVFETFQAELRDFRGKNPLMRLIRSLSPIWDIGFVLTSLEKMKDNALHMHDSDWKRYSLWEEHYASLQRTET
ncbi:MAG: hypothetical protein ABIG30_01355 [Candidatus Aenigmatarchaeota archaeon]